MQTSSRTTTSRRQVASHTEVQDSASASTATAGKNKQGVLYNLSRDSFFLSLNFYLPLIMFPPELDDLMTSLNNFKMEDR